MSEETASIPEVSIKDAAKGMLVAEPVAEDESDILTPEELASLGVDPPIAADGTTAVAVASVSSEPPKWAIIPKGLVFPKGRTIYFVRFPADMTDTPADGERQCIMWNLNMADEDLALARARGSQLRVNRELTMAMIRAVDGVQSDWTQSLANSAGSVRIWMNKIGARCRLQLQNIYMRTHGVDEDMRKRFFTDCLVSMTSI